MNRESSAPVLRPMTPFDIDAGLRLCRASRWNQLADDWRGFLVAPGGGAWLIEHGGAVIGTSACMSYGHLAWIAMMLVDPDRRGEGLGARLLDAALSSLQDAPCVGLDATPLGEPLYRRFGFHETCTLARWRATIDVTRLPYSADHSRPMHARDLPEIFRFDREVFGADRSPLLRSLLDRAPEAAWVASTESELTGYVFGRPGHHAAHIGPVVAREPQIAKRLLVHALSRCRRPEIIMDTPLSDNNWLQFASSLGFAEERRFTRMFRNGHAHPGLPGRQFAICGPEFA